MPQTKFLRNLWELYFKELLRKYLDKNNLDYTESGLIRASEKLADLLVDEKDVFETNMSSILSGTFDAKTWLETKISTMKFN